MLTVGTRGDIQPFVAIGAGLLARGHEVRFVASVDQTPFAERVGLTTRALPFDAKAVMESERGQQLLRNGHVLRFAAMLRDATAEVIDELLPILVEEVRRADLVVAHALMLPYPMMLTDEHRIVRVNTAPLVPTAAFASPLAGRANLGPLNRASHAIIGHLGWWSARAAIAAIAKFAGVPVPGNCWARAEQIGMPALNIASPVLVPRPADAPACHVFTGDLRLASQLRAQLGEARIDPALEQFLAAGAPPVFFGFGSMPVADPAATLALVVEVARALDVRALLGAGWSAIPAGALEDGRVFVTGAFDHDAVLPRCIAAVHHGGAGTTHAALRAGLPAVVCPFLVDQPWWADVLIGHGVGAKLPFPKLTAARLVAALRPLLAAEVKARAEALANSMRSENGVDVAVEHIERAGTTRTAPANHEGAGATLP